MAIQLIVGLGNPGQQYSQTRHNAGAWYVEALAREYGAQLKEDSKYFGLTGRCSIDGHDVRLLLPTTFMNESGKSTSAFANFFKIPVEDMLIAHDELDLPPGTVRFKQGGGHGGHNGLRDIVACHGNNKNFSRLRIGIGHPGDAKKVSGYVLNKAPQSEQELIDLAVEEAVKVTANLYKQNMQKAMNKLNGFKASK